MVLGICGKKLVSSAPHAGVRAVMANSPLPILTPYLCMINLNIILSTVPDLPSDSILSDLLTKFKMYLGFQEF